MSLCYGLIPVQGLGTVVAEQPQMHDMLGVAKTGGRANGNMPGPPRPYKHPDRQFRPEGKIKSSISAVQDWVALPRSSRIGYNSGRYAIKGRRAPLFLTIRLGL